MSSRQERFVERMYQAARNIGLQEPQARLAAAQAALETAYGRSVKGNNYFGIKAGSSWKGKTQRFKTWEEEKGRRVNRQDNFRAYATPEESLKDWASLMERRYPEVMKAQSFDQAKKGLRYGKKGGYATDTKYGSKLSFIDSKFNSASVAPQVQLASLPEPATRPSLEEQLGYEPGGLLAPETAGSFSPVSTANAAPVDMGLLSSDISQPTARSLAAMAEQYGGYQQARDVQSKAGSNAAPQATIEASPTTNAPQGLLSANQPSMAVMADQLGQYGQGRAPGSYQAARQAEVDVHPESQITPDSPAAQIDQGLLAAPAVPDAVANNLESMTPEEALVSQPVVAAKPAQPQVQQPVSQQPVLAAPVQAQPTNPFEYTPTPPPAASGNDVWNGKSDFGVANGGYELTRFDNGSVGRYSPKFDRTDILGPGGQFKSQHQGRIEGPIGNNGIGFKPSFSNPLGQAQTKTGHNVRGALGAVAGGVAGNVFGPVVGLLASAMGRNLAQGKGLLSREMTPGFYNGQRVTDNTFPDAPNNSNYVGNGVTNPNWTAENAYNAGHSSSIVEQAFSGKGGLF